MEKTRVQKLVALAKAVNKRKAYTRYVDAKCLPTPDGKYTSEAMIEMRHAMLDALQSDEPLPAEMQRDLAIAYKSLFAGMVDDLLKPDTKYGTREPLIFEQLRIDAIRYLHWVEDGRIDDADPIATVAQAYQLGKKAIKNWRDEWCKKPTPSFNYVFAQEPIPGFLKANGDDDDDAIGPEPAIPEKDVVTALMLSAGKAYQRFKTKRKPRGY